MRRTLSYLVASWNASLRAALEYRVSFAVQAGFMLANNFLFLAFWKLFFARVPAVGGWTIKDVALCYGIAASAFGLAAVLCGGTIDLAASVSGGRLDTWLLRPQPVLLQALASRMRLSGFGDLVTGPILLVLCGNTQPARVALFALGVTAGGLVYTAFVTASQASAFWFGRAEDLAGQSANAILSFALYPPGIFSGPARVLLFTLVPAGLMSWLPAELVLHPTAEGAALLLLGAASACGVALVLWTRGLARYESGNLTQATGD